MQQAVMTAPGNIQFHEKDWILACDHFTVEPLFWQTLYVLFFIELASHRVPVAGCTAYPKSAWVTQQARRLIWRSEGRSPRLQSLTFSS
jgi:hypothetical protein